MGNVAVTGGIHHRTGAIIGSAGFVFHSQLRNAVIFQGHIYHIASVKDVHTLLQQQQFRQDGKDLGIILNLVALVLLRSGADPLQPVFRIIRFRTVGYGKLQQFFRNAEGNLMTESIAQGQIYGNQAGRSQTTQHIFLLKQNHLFAFPGCSQSCGNARETTAAHSHIILRCHNPHLVLSIP